MRRTGGSNGKRNLLLAATIISLSTTMMIQTPVKAGELEAAIANEDTPSYTLNELYYLDSDLGTLAGENRDFTILGNTKGLRGNNKIGITTSEGQTLTIKDLSSFEGFKTYAITNGGTVEVQNVAFADNTTDINNTGTLNLSGNNEISTIAGAGTTNITGGNTIISEGGSVTQNKINLQGGRLVNSVAITANVVADEAHSASSDSFGGAIYNKGTISKITGIFKDNTVNHTLGNSFGGAIFNDVGSNISTVNADFTNNTAFSGGAIYNNGNYLGNGVIDKIIGDFTGNKALGASEYGSGIGGAIANFGTINQLSGSFTNNTALVEAAWGSNGGAIYNNGTLTIKSLAGDPITFSNNQAYNTGGAIANSDYSTKPLTITADGSSITFEGNSAKNGGALYNNSYVFAGTPEDGGVITLNATGADITFTGNTATEKGGAIYNNYGATVNMNSTGENKINFATSSDTIHNEGTININGNVVINSLITDNATPTGTLNLNGGTLKLGSNAGVSNLNVLTFANTPTLDLQNSAAQTLAAKSVNGNANLNIDIDFTGENVIADAINITTGGQTGVLTIDKITALGGDSAIKEFSNLEILKGTTSGVTLKLSDAIKADSRFNVFVRDDVTHTNDYSDTATFDKTVFTTTEWTETFKKKLTLDDTSTKLSFSETVSDGRVETGSTTQDVLQALNQSTSETRSLTATDSNKNYTVGADLGETKAGTLSVVGLDGSTLDMNTNTGFELTNANTILNLTNLSIIDINDTADGKLITTTGTGSKANLKNVTIASTTNNAISNAVELNLSGTNNLGTGIVGTEGTTNITGGKTTVGSIIQNAVNITAGELEVTNITANIANAGTLTLKGTTNANTITGEGTTVIASSLENTGSIEQAITVNGSNTFTTAANLIGGAVANSGTVELTGGALNKAITGGNITIKSGEVTSTAENLAGNITNNSNLLLSGNLNKAIGGTTGTTKLNDNMTVADSGSIAGILDFNGKTITMSGDNTTSTFNVGKITSNGTINIDVNSSGTPVYDAINLTTTGSTGTITINSITEIGSRGDDFTLNILQGNVGNLELALSTAVQNQFNQAEQHNLYYVSDDYSANITFDKTSFDTTEYDKVTQKTIGVEDKTKIKYSTKTISDSATGTVTSKDALAFINQNTDTSAIADRSLKTTDTNKTYTVTEDLGTTGAGTLLVQGADDKTSKLDMNGKTGFNVVNAETTVNLTNLNITGTKAQDGSLINITNASSSTNLDGVTVATNSANVISSKGTLGVTNSTINAGINNTGTMNLDGANTIAKVVGDNGTTEVKAGGTTTVGSIFQKLINIVSGGKLASNGNVTATNGITNAAADGLEINNGKLTGNVTGDGTTKFTGTSSIDENSKVSQAVNVASGTLTAKADSLAGAVTNGGTVDLTNGKLSTTITGGNTKVSGTVEIDDSTGSISNAVAVTIGTGAKLTSNADKIGGAITNNGVYNITGGTIANAISGAGAINITGKTINNATNTTTGAVTVAEGVELVINTGDTFGTASSLTMGNGSTLNIQNGSTTTAAINNLVIANSGDIVNVKMDWGDIINSSSSEIAGSLIVSDINMATSTKSYDDTTYLFTNLGDKIALSTPVSLSNISDTTNNFVSYDNTTGKLTSYRNSLIRAVDKTGSGATATYVMTEDETAGGEELIGTLKVQGGGHTINTLGIKVGSTSTTGADLTLEDVNMNVAGKALEVHGGNKVAVNATGHDITLQTTGTDEVISLSKGSASSIATAELGGSKTINITGDIKSDVVDNTLTIAAGTTVNHNGLLDPITVNVNGTENRTGGYDETVTYNVNNGGNLNFTNDSTLYDAGHHTAAMLNTIKFNGGTVNTINGVVTDFNLANMSLTGTSYFKADVDLAGGTMDKFTVTNPVTGSGTLNVSQLNLISDATSPNTTINFTTDPVLMAAVNYTGAQGLTALSPIYRYNVGYDSSNGNFDFTRYATGGYGDFNPAIMAAPVAAQMGGYLTQLNSYDEAFYNMDMYMLMTKEQRQALKFKNKYASADSKYLYDSTLLRQERAEGWFRPFATFEKVGLKNGPKVGNVAYGTYMGGESEMYDLGHGWDGMWGAYVGYNGSHQTYDGVGIYQNGGTLGLVGMAYKGNFFTGLTLNAGASGVEASTMYGNEDFSMLMSGIASKTGYNWELFNGKFIVQPSMLMSYSFVNTFDYRNGAGVKIDSDPLHAIQLQPEIKFIGNLKNGWQPYASVAVVWNIMDDTKFKANDVALPELSVKPYVKYGVGVRKTWGERLTGFFQTYITNGGRNGVGLQAGFTWALGRGNDKKANEAKIQKSLNKVPELENTDIVLNGKKVQ